MRDPDQLTHVLHSLLAHPELTYLLKQPQALATYLDHEAWPELPDGTDLWQENSPDSLEAAEEAELMPLVEEQLADLELTPPQQETLKQALGQTCPDCQDMLQILMPCLGHRHRQSHDPRQS